MRKTFIEKKYEQLQALNSESTEALDIVTNTINKLDSINTRIANVVSEIEDAEQQLTDTKNGLNKTREHNAQIMEKFRNLIGEA
jgi:uncharacterized coiled-coil DUF342 family protein